MHEKVSVGGNFAVEIYHLYRGFIMFKQLIFIAYSYIVLTPFITPQL
jgi:hypothetical protein